jgi:hypothetical protein
MIEDTQEEKPVFNIDKGVPDDLLGRWRSIEFELVFNSQKDLDDFVEFVEANSYDKFITIKEDGSIEQRLAENVAREIVVSYCAGKKEQTDNKYPRTKIVWDVCKFLKGRAYVNNSCGTHVHFDMRGFKREDVERFGARLACAVPALKKILPKSRRENDNCHDVINSIDGVGDDYDFGYSDDRYCFVNMQAYRDHKTIEVRGHAGTINAKKILNWIKICEKIMSNRKPKEKNYFHSPAELCEYYKFDKELGGYIMGRYTELNAPRDAQPAP